MSNLQEKVISILVSREFVNRLQQKASITPDLSPEELVDAYLWHGLMHHKDAVKLEKAFQNRAPSVVEELSKKIKTRIKTPLRGEKETKEKAK